MFFKFVEICKFAFSLFQHWRLTSPTARPNDGYAVASLILPRIFAFAKILAMKKQANLQIYIFCYFNFGDCFEPVGSRNDNGNKICKFASTVILSVAKNLRLNFYFENLRFFAYRLRMTTKWYQHKFL